jgi:hypothetical protein
MNDEVPVRSPDDVINTADATIIFKFLNIQVSHNSFLSRRCFKMVIGDYLEDDSILVSYDDIPLIYSRR